MFSVDHIKIVRHFFLIVHIPLNTSSDIMAIKKVDINVFNASAQKARETGETKNTLSIESHRTSEGEKGQCYAEINTKNGGVHKLMSDEPPFLGGTGMYANPIQYVLYGVCSCMSAGVAKIAALKNITIEELRVRTTVEIDLEAAMLISDKPIYQSMSIDVYVKCDASEKDLEEILEKTKAGSPVLSVITTPVRPSFTISNE